MGLNSNDYNSKHHNRDDLNKIEQLNDTNEKLTDENEALQGEIKLLNLRIEGKLNELKAISMIKDTLSEHLKLANSEKTTLRNQVSALRGKLSRRERFIRTQLMSRNIYYDNGGWCNSWCGNLCGASTSHGNDETTTEILTSNMDEHRQSKDYSDENLYFDSNGSDSDLDEKSTQKPKHKKRRRAHDSAQQA